MHHALAQLSARGFTDMQGYAMLMRSLVGQAYLLAADDLFWISGWLSVALLGIVWLTRRSLANAAVVVAE